MRMIRIFSKRENTNVKIDCKLVHIYKNMWCNIQNKCKENNFSILTCSKI